MLGRWWNSLGFYWQVYLVTVLAFSAIIMIVEAVAEPLVAHIMAERLHHETFTSEFIMWAASIFIPTLIMGFVLTHMVVRKMTGMVAMAKRLACGDLTARIATKPDSTDVFSQLARIFNGMAGALERLFLHEKRLLADISHELRSPLARMGVATALLPMKKDSDEFESVVKVLEDEIAHMNGLVKMLLEQGRNRLNEQNAYSRISLTELVADTVATYEETAKKDGKKIDSELEQGIEVWGSPVRIRMIIDNILSNAVFYTPQKSTIQVRVSQNGDQVVVSIRDNGTGVPEECLVELFRPFFRVDPSRARNSGGVGLGLALARDAAIAMGGDITARNTHPGLDVIVTLPKLTRGKNLSDSKGKPEEPDTVD